jgi:hypothetical protein
VNKTLFSIGGWLAIMLSMYLATASVATGQIQVNSAAPSAAPQGTTNLNVVVKGSGFKKGAQAQWFVTGTTNPGGVTVNSTAFNNSGQLTANITVASEAVVSGFDIVVTNTDRRTGKGTDKFAVTVKGTPIGCDTTGTPSGFTLVTELNPVQSNGAALITTGKLGNAIRVRPLDLNKDGIVDTLVTFVASGGGAAYAYFLDPVNGTTQVTNPVTGAVWQNPVVLLTGTPAVIAATGDVNGDGVPDFVMANGGSTAYLFVGNVTPGTYTVSYTAFQIPHPASAPGYWGMAVAMGDLDNDGVDEIAIGAHPAKGEKNLPGVYLYKFTAGAPTYVRKIEEPSGILSTHFGDSISIGNVDGNPGNELIVGAMAANSNTGIVYVFPYPAQQSTFFSLSGPGSNFGLEVDAGDVTGDSLPDLVIANSSQAFFYPGPVHSGQSYTDQLLPAPGLDENWEKRDGDVGFIFTTGAIAVGAPAASTSQSCVSSNAGVGAVHLFTGPFAASQFPSYVFQPPDLVGSTEFQFGVGVGMASGYPLLVIGEHYRDVGTTFGAGQVYVYRKN